MESSDVPWCISPPSPRLSLCLPVLFFLQLFAIVVFATITAEGYVNPTQTQELACVFNNNDSACSYGVGIGVLAFLACAAFLILDAYFPRISNANERKAIVIGDLVFSGETRVSVGASCSSTNELSSTTGSAVGLKLMLLPCLFPNPDAPAFELSTRRSGLDSPVVHLLLCLDEPLVPNTCRTGHRWWCPPSCCGLFLLLDLLLGEHLMTSACRATQPHRWNICRIVWKLLSLSSHLSQQTLLTYFAYGRYRQGINEMDQEYRDPANDHNTPYPPYASSTPTGYQQSPFPQSQEQPGEYQPPSYWRT